MTHHRNTPPATVMITDDNPVNITMLERLCTDAGYTVRAATSGAETLRSAATAPPDILLLDIHMPEMDGYEVCRRFKATPALADVPVIFISALSESFNKVQAFAAGGSDYLTKPFQVEEVLARVAVHLRLRQMHRELEQQNRRLQETQELGDRLISMIVHDMRSPLHAILGYVELLAEDVAISADNRQMLHQVEGSAGLLDRMVDSLLDVRRLEENRLPLEPVDAFAADIVSRAVNGLGRRLENHRVTLRIAPGEETIRCDEELIYRVVTNLLDNAVKYSPVGSEIEVATTFSRGRARFTVCDHGTGIPPEFHTRIFEKFGQVEARSRGGRRSIGLGLAFCRLAVEAHGGAIGLESDETGSCFWFELPAAGPEPPASSS